MNVVDFLRAFVRDDTFVNVAVHDTSGILLVTYVSGYANRDALIGLLNTDMRVIDAYADDGRLIINVVREGD